MTRYLEIKPGSISETIKRLSDDYQAIFKKELEKTGKGIGSMTPDEKKAFFNKIDKMHNAKNEEIKPKKPEDSKTVMVVKPNAPAGQEKVIRVPKEKLADYKSKGYVEAESYIPEAKKIDELTAGQKKLPPALQKAIKAKEKKEEVELNDLIKEIEEIEEAISSDELNLNEENFNAFLNVASRITKLKSDLQKLDKSKPDSKDKEEIIKSRIATAELKMKNIQQKQKAEKERQKKDPEYKVDYSKIGKKEEVNKESTSRNINEGARALVEAIAALQKKADKSGMPYSILKQVYDRGMAAWKGGHRPGASQHQWAFARVNSFVTKSSGTWGGADSDLAKKVKGKE